MACDNLTHTISFSNNTPLIGETVTCTATVTNNGSTTEQFHVVFAQSGMSPFSTSTVRTIAPGATIAVTGTFQGTIATTVNICADVVCDTIPTGVFQYYPSDYYWNVRCDHLPVHSNSQTYINYFDTVLSGSWTTPHKHFIGTIAGGYRPNAVTSATPRKSLTFCNYQGVYDIWSISDYTLQYPVTSSMLVSPPGMEMGENTYYMIDKSLNKLWGVYDGRLNYRYPTPPPACSNSSLIASTGDICGVSAWTWDLNSYALRPDGHPSNSMSGTCPPAGAIRKDEWDAGVINHALFAAAYHVSSDWVYPARASGSGTSNPSGEFCIPNGTRFRLKSSYDINAFSSDPDVRMVLTCLKKYGFFVLENGWQPEVVFYSEAGHTLSYSKFTGIPWSAFEAVNMTSMIDNNDSGKMKAGTF